MTRPHLSMTRPSEVPKEIYNLADVFVSVGPDRPINFVADGAGAIWNARPERPPIDEAHTVVTLMDVVRGRAVGRTTADQISLYGALTGYSMGILYPAFGAEVLTRAQKRGVGRIVPVEWLLQTDQS